MLQELAALQQPRVPQLRHRVGRLEEPRRHRGVWLDAADEVASGGVELGGQRVHLLVEGETDRREGALPSRGARAARRAAARRAPRRAARRAADATRRRTSGRRGLCHALDRGGGCAARGRAHAPRRPVEVGCGEGRADGAARGRGKRGGGRGGAGGRGVERSRGGEPRRGRRGRGLGALLGRPLGGGEDLGEKGARRAAREGSEVGRERVVVLAEEAFDLVAHLGRVVAHAEGVGDGLPAGARKEGVARVGGVESLEQLHVSLPRQPGDLVDQEEQPRRRPLGAGLREQCDGCGVVGPLHRAPRDALGGVELLSGGTRGVGSGLGSGLGVGSGVR